MTAPVTLQSIVGDVVRWLGQPLLGASTIPPIPLPPLEGLWLLVRRVGYTAFNSAPVAYPTLNNVDELTGIATGNLNATDADGDALTYTVVTPPTRGTLTLDEDGAFTYTPDSPDAGDDAFTVAISDTAGNPPHLHGIFGLIGVNAQSTVTVPTTLGPSPSTPLTQAQYDAAFSGTPSLFGVVEVAAIRLVNSVAGLFDSSFGQLLAPLSSASPPGYLTSGLNVEQTEFDGMPVWEISSPDPSGKYVVAIHGGQFAIQPGIPAHWLAYTSMVRNTGATVIVPIYPLIQEGGTAATVVPKMADLIEQEIQDHGAENVSVFGDSAGGTIALAAAQLLARRGDTEPASMVLLSPLLDLTFSNPNIALVDDPLVDAETGRQIAQAWARGLPVTDTLVSPLYGSLDGLPPTAVYAGSLSVLAPDTLVLQREAQTHGAPFTFVLALGQIEDWVLFPFGDGPQWWPQIYQELGLTSTQHTVTDQVG